MSFENILAQKGASPDAKPEIKVQVNLDAKKRTAENQFEIITKLNVTSSAKDSGEPLFVMELEYAGIFHVEGVPEEQMHPYLLIECPRITFPFVRRVVSDVTRDGGFPPLNLETIDFLALYRSEIARRVEAQKAETPVQ
jgi:preprotein translocase subunit SecB